MRIKAVKKDIARIKTVMREMELKSRTRSKRKGGLSCERKKPEKNQGRQSCQQQDG